MLMNAIQWTLCFCLDEGCSADVLRIATKEVYRSCHQTYSSDTEDTTPFHGPKWSRLENYSHFESIYHNIYQKPWIYQRASEINTLSHYAVEGKYDGGGFVADFFRLQHYNSFNRSTRT